MMKIKFILFIIVAQLTSATLYSHKQHAHQYITIQAYKLLERALLIGYPEMIAHLGVFEGDIGSGPWQLGKITTGAWREDEEDVVYGYEDKIWLDGGAISGTHFWDADNGDLTMTTIRVLYATVVYTAGPYENAYEKMREYANPNYNL